MTTANTKTPLRAGCYLRISSDPSNRRVGVDRQEEDTSAECEMHEWVVAGFYVDNDRSASNGQARPEWDRLLADVKAGKIDVIVVWNQDRAWRKMADFEALRPVLGSLGVLFATTNLGVIDFNNPDDMHRVQSSTANSELEVARLRIRLTRAAKQKAQRGKPQWKRAFGYTDNYELNPETAPWVAKVYAHVLAGGSISDGARMLNEAGVLAEKWVHPRDENGDRIDGSQMECIRTPWSPSTLSLFLRKPRNAGLRDHNDVIVIDTNGQPVKGAWPPLVDEMTWRAAQDVLNAPGRAPGRKSVRRHKLTGVMRCGKCGEGRLNGVWAAPRHGSKNAGHEITYSCKNCRGVGIRANDVEPLLYEIVSEKLGREDAVDLLVNKAHDSTEAERIRTERAVLLTQIETANREYDDGIIDGARLKGRTERAKEKLVELDRRGQDQERLRVLDGLPLGKSDKIETAVKDLTADRFRAVVDLLVEITVLPVGRGSHNRTFNPDRVRNGLVWKV